MSRMSRIKKVFLIKRHNSVTKLIWLTYKIVYVCFNVFSMLLNSNNNSLITMRPHSRMAWRTENPSCMFISNVFFMHYHHICPSNSLSCFDRQKNFIWLDGMRWSYNGWAKGEPNNRGGKENCVETWCCKCCY